MSYINNMNPRRMIWFNQNAPKNKMDIWLSYNRHYEDTSEDETVDPQQVDDNSSQRKCDLILKAWDCGKWVPIVGFNTTAANKIDIVENNNLYHPAIFTGQNPNDLYDAGTLGSLLSDTNFVTQEEWYDVFNSTDYNWSDIFGDTNWFGDLIWETIQGGSSTYHLPFATTERCGGILSDIHTYGAVSAFKPIEVKFYPTTNAYSSKLHRLCVSASDVIQQINNYYNDNPSGQALTIPLATYEKIGGARIQTDTTTQDYRGVPVLFGGPNAGLTYGNNTPEGLILYGDSATYNPDNSFLYVPAWAIMDIISNPTGEQTPEPMIRNGFGTFAQWNIDSRTGLNYCTISLQCTPNQDKGKYLRINSAGTDIEWADVQGGTEYEELGPSNTDQNLYVVRGLDDSQKTRYLLGGNGRWTRVGYGISTSYNAGNDEMMLNQYIHKQLDATIDSLTTPSLIFTTTITQQGDEIVNVSYDNTGLIISEYQYKIINISVAATLYFNNISNNECTNPVRIKIVTSNNLNLSFTNTKYICEGDNPLTALPKDTEWLLTFQFGVVRFEKIITPTSQS